MIEIPKLEIANVNGVDLIVGDDGMGLLGVEQLAEVIRRAEVYEGLAEALHWLLEEYHFLSRKMTEINNIVQPLWGELRERRNDYQLVEKFIEQIQKEGLEQALGEPK